MHHCFKKKMYVVSFMPEDIRTTLENNALCLLSSEAAIFPIWWMTFLLDLPLFFVAFKSDYFHPVLGKYMWNIFAEIINSSNNVPRYCVFFILAIVRKIHGVSTVFQSTDLLSYFMWIIQ